MRIVRFETAGLACKLIFNYTLWSGTKKPVNRLVKKQHANGIEKYWALKYSPLIWKLQVTFTKRLSFKTTFKGHSITMYLNHASTKDVINDTKPASDLDIFKDCAVYSWTLFSEIAWTLNYGDIKSRYPNITAAMEKLLYFWVDISDKRATNQQ